MGRLRVKIDKSTFLSVHISCCWEVLLDEAEYEMLWDLGYHSKKDEAENWDAVDLQRREARPPRDDSS